MSFREKPSIGSTANINSEPPGKTRVTKSDFAASKVRWQEGDFVDESSTSESTHFSESNETQIPPDIKSDPDDPERLVPLILPPIPALTLAEEASPLIEPGLEYLEPKPDPYQYNADPAYPLQDYYTFVPDDPYTHDPSHPPLYDPDSYYPSGLGSGVGVGYGGMDLSNLNTMEQLCDGLPTEYLDM